ncbi:MAG TPA: MiaB/RimO family radical SAM methylthiotransferase [Thermoanaerobaculia bacterium]|nr:MiaB/RimO family radical SAM methylthiotransferase [Thermoanaerobaculia bacterium]
MRVFFSNLGCKLNQAETERLARDFVAAGHRLAGSLDQADLHVVNSCTVTRAAARDSRKAAGRGGRCGRRVRTVLTGCDAGESSTAAESFRAKDVDLVVPNRHKDRLLALVHQAFPETLPAPPPADSALPYMPLPFGNTRALVKVEDGCDMRCAFCIVPSTRGRQRSRPLDDVLGEVRALAAAGYRELVVTGVQISAYRSGSLRLHELVGAVLAALPPAGSPGEARLRLTSIAPWDLDPRLLAAWSDRRLCRHLHLSLQSGSTATLRRMRRPYTAERYARLVENVRAAIPGVAVTTDVIVGFPGETAGEFAESLGTVEALGFARVHVFPFSARPGTEAAGLPHPVEPELRRERMRRMLAVARDSERTFWRAHLGKRATVLWERPKNGRGHGLTDNYIRVWSPAGAALWNRFAAADLVSLSDEGVHGELVSGPAN